MKGKKVRALNLAVNREEFQLLSFSCMTPGSRRGA